MCPTAQFAFVHRAIFATFSESSQGVAPPPPHTVHTTSYNDLPALSENFRNRGFGTKTQQDNQLGIDNKEPNEQQSQNLTDTHKGEKTPNLKGNVDSKRSKHKKRSETGCFLNAGSATNDPQRNTEMHPERNIGMDVS